MRAGVVGDGFKLINKMGTDYQYLYLHCMSSLIIVIGR